LPLGKALYFSGKIALLEHLYKYTDIKAAEASLVNQSFRYSSPLKFNDPFDIQNELSPSFDMSDFPSSIMSVIEHYVKNDLPIPNSDEGFGKAILMLRGSAKSQGYKKRQIEEITYPLLGHLMDDINHAIEGLNKQWKISMLESRVFCVTEDNDNLLMWAHYAKDHTGLVFQLATLSEEDNILSAARKVHYTEKPVQFYSSQELIEWILFGVEPDFKKILYSLHAHQKSEHWDYENEWRVVDMQQYQNKAELYIDHKFVPKQLENIFFGCKADPEDIDRLSEIARGINPSVGIFKSFKKPLEYALGFKEIYQYVQCSPLRGWTAKSDASQQRGPLTKR
jgi:hypothetical protein